MVNVDAENVTGATGVDRPVKSRPALTPRQLNRATLDRQLLLRRRTMDVTDAVRRVLALQAQEPASPYLALWNRIDSLRPRGSGRGVREPVGGEGTGRSD